MSKYGVCLSQVLNYTRVHSLWVRHHCLLEDYGLSNLIAISIGVGLISPDPKAVCVHNYFFMCKFAIAPSLKYSPAFSFEVLNSSSETASKADA